MSHAIGLQDFDDGWRDIKDCPDNTKILGTVKDRVCGVYHEPEIYRKQGDYWYYRNGDRAFAKPDLWRPLPSPPKEIE